MVVVASSFAAGFGGFLWWLVQDFSDSGKVFAQSFILGSILAVVLWGFWFFLVYVLLTQVFRERTDLQQLLRTMGLGSAPLALMLLMFIPGIDFGIGLASLVLLFGLTSIGIQAATTADPARVLVANLAGFTIWAIVLTLLVTDDTFAAPGIFLFDAPKEAIQSLPSLTDFLGE
jgi:branched-subunit amino acid ABC-type transport system permease component